MCWRSNIKSHARRKRRRKNSEHAECADATMTTSKSPNRKSPIRAKPQTRVTVVQPMTDRPRLLQYRLGHQQPCGHRWQKDRYSFKLTRCSQHQTSKTHQGRRPDQIWGDGKTKSLKQNKKQQHWLLVCGGFYLEDKLKLELNATQTQGIQS